MSQTETIQGGGRRGADRGDQVLRADGEGCCPAQVHAGGEGPHRAEGFRREVTVSDLCRREGIKPHSNKPDTNLYQSRPGWTNDCGDDWPKDLGDSHESVLALAGLTWRMVQGLGAGQCH